jgi:DNA-binding protein YbaB
VDEELRASLEEAAETHRQRMAGLARLRRELKDVSVTARSRDGLVRVSLGPGGRVRDIRFEPQVYERLNPQRLAATVMELIDTAAREVTEREREAVAEHMPDSLAERLRHAEDDLSEYFPEGPSLSDEGK